MAGKEMIVLLGAFTFFAIFFGLSMCTSCQSAPETSGKRKFFNVIMKVMPFRQRFETFLQNYNKGKSYAFFGFVVAIVVGTWLICSRYWLHDVELQFPKPNSKRTIMVHTGFVMWDHYKGNVFMTMLLCANIIFSYLVVFNADPNCVREYQTDQLLNIPKRQKHCKICQASRTRFDHHCIWISNCVAGGNQVQFVYFLVSSIVVCLWHVYVGVIYFIEIVNRQVSGRSYIQLIKSGQMSLMQVVSSLFSSQSSVVAVILVLLAIGTTLIPFTLGQIRAVVRNQTTFEHLKLLKLVGDVKKGIKTVYNENGVLNFDKKGKVVSARKLMKYNVYDLGFVGNIRDSVTLAFRKK